MTQKYLPDWLRAVGIDPSNEPLDARQRANVEFVSGADRDVAHNLVRLAHEHTADTESTARFAEKHREHDPAFPLRDNERLLAVLAGSAVMNVLASDTALSTFTGYVVTCAGLQGWKPLVPDLVGEAAVRLVQRSAMVRQTSLALQPASKVVVWSQEAATKVRETPAQGDAAAIPADLPMAIQLAATHAGLAVDRTAVYALENDQRLLQYIHVLEESNTMLWWVISGATTVGLQAAVPSATAIMGAWQLAELTRFLPGPRQAPELLGQMVRFAAEPGPSEITIDDALVQVPAQVEPPPVVEVLLDLTPILGGAHKRMPAVSHDKYSCVELARRAYIEVMLTRSYEEAPS